MSISINNNANTQPYQAQQPKNHITDKFQTMVRNSADMNDCLTVPRTIFKGYLGIMTGTTMCALTNCTQKANLKKGLNVAGLLTSLYGTWAFVRPYILKSAHEVTTLPKQK